MMYQQIFSAEDLEQLTNLEYTINASGCSVKIENQSPYAVEVYTNQQQLDRITPYSYRVVPNGDYTIKVNKTIKSDNVQPYNFISYKMETGTTTPSTGSTTFTGTANVAGDMNITGGQIDAYVQGDVKLAPDTTVNASIQGDVNLAPGTSVNIANAEIPITGSVSIASGTVEANISNAEIKTDIVTAKLGTNNLVNIGTFPIEYSPTQTSLQIPVNFEPGLYDNFLFAVVGTKELPDGTGNTQTYILPIVSLTVNGTEFKGVPTQNVITLTPGRFAVGDNSKAAYNGTFPKEEPIDTVYITVQVQNNWWNAQGGWATVQLTMNAWNSNSFKNKSLEADRFKSLTTDTSALYQNGGGGIELFNTDIIGVNSLVLNDSANASTEGIMFPKTGAAVKSTNSADYDTLRVLDGKIYITSDVVYERELATVSGLDLNTITVNKQTYVISAVNKPATASSPSGFVRHYQRSGGYAMQWYEPMGAGLAFELWVRRMNAGTWEAWKKITMV